MLLRVSSPTRGRNTRLQSVVLTTVHKHRGDTRSLLGVTNCRLCSPMTNVPNSSQRRLRFSGGTTRTLAAALALVAVACSGGGDEGAPAPTARFSLFDGTQASLSSFAGTPLVVNFWASWCPSCVAEMSAAFKPVQEELGEQVTFLGVNTQDERSLAIGLLAQTGVQWISADDPLGELYAELGGIAMPFTVFISSEGRIVDKHNGPLSEGLLRDRIAEVLGV